MEAALWRREGDGSVLGLRGEKKRDHEGERRGLFGGSNRDFAGAAAAAANGGRRAEGKMMGEERKKIIGGTPVGVSPAVKVVRRR